ncbi:fibronectin type III domain-containing protein [Vibrio sp. PP-XX7]
MSLTWHQPADYEKVIDYKVYQNGKFIGLSSDNNAVHSPAAPYIQAFFDADADGFHQPTTYLSYKVTNLVANTQYQFSVRAVYADGTESSSSAVLLPKPLPSLKKWSMCLITALLAMG